MISCEDVQRVAIEVMKAAEDAQDEHGEDHRVLADQWGASVELEEGVMAMVCNGISEAFSNAMIASALQGLGEHVTVDDEEGVAIEPSALSWAIEMTIISAFRWGFETARQYAPQTVVDVDS